MQEVYQGERRVALRFYTFTKERHQDKRSPAEMCRRCAWSPIAIAKVLMGTTSLRAQPTAIMEVLETELEQLMPPYHRSIDAAIQRIWVTHLPKALYNTLPTHCAFRWPLATQNPALQESQLSGIPNMSDFDPLFDKLPEDTITSLLGVSPETYQGRLNEDWNRLQDIFRNADPIELLATVSFYALFKAHDRMEGVETDEPYSQAHVELIQSAALTIPPSEYGREPSLLPRVFATLDLAKQCAESYATKQYCEIANAPANEKLRSSQILGARIHTQMMRNWAHPQHMKALTVDLFKPLDGELQQKLGMTGSQFLDLLNGIRKETEHRANEFIKKIGHILRPRSIRKIVERCLAEAEENDDQVVEIVKSIKARNAKREQVCNLVLEFFHAKLPEIFMFRITKLSELVSGNVPNSCLRALFERLSLAPGSLHDEIGGDVFLNSPIQGKPVIKMSESEYFIPIPGLLHSNCVQLLESEIERFPELKDRYHVRRSVFLQTKLTELFRFHFPSSTIVPEAKWTDTDGKQYETDLVVLLGSYLIVVEAKANRVTGSARRGGRERLARDLTRLVADPAEQAKRLAKRIRIGGAVVDLRCTNSKEPSSRVDPSQVSEVICCSVTLDWLPVLSLCWTDAVATGLSPDDGQPVLNMTLADLLVVFDVLQNESIRLHYLSRRVRFERQLRYIADEEDLLVYYLEEGFPDFKRDHDESQVALILYGKSIELRRHYMAGWVDPKTLVPKPQRVLTEWWGLLVTKVAELDNPRRWELACALLDTPYLDQIGFEREWEKDVDVVKRLGKNCVRPGLFYLTPSNDPRVALVAFSYSLVTLEYRNKRANELIVAAHAELSAKYVVLIGRDVDRQCSPYDFLAFSGGLRLD